MPDIPRDATSEEQRSVPERIGSDLQAATDTVSEAAGDLVDTAAAEMADIRQAAESQVAEAAEKAKGFADEHKNIAADQIGGVSAALARVADDLAADEKTAPVAGYARSIAENTRRASDALHGSSVEDLIEMAQRFGRQQPVAFLGIAALAGFAAGRFMVASSTRPAGRSPADGPIDNGTDALDSVARDDEIALDGASHTSSSSNGGAFK